VGIRWQTQKPAPVAAEIWTPAMPTEAPPRPAPEPKPVPQPPPPPPVARAPEPTPPVAQPDVVLERQREAERKARDEAARLEEERRAAERRREEEARRQEIRRKEAEARKAAEEKARREAEEKARREAEEKKRAAAEEARREAQEKARAEKEEKQRQAHVERLRASAGTPAAGAPGAVGSAGGGTDTGYVARLSALIRSNTTYQAPADLAGNPKAIFVVTVSPDCAILSVKLRRSSGIAAWDEAAGRGIQRSSPLPRQRDGSCPPELEIARGPKDDQ
jgi:colicin import membrane protein